MGKRIFFAFDIDEATRGRIVSAAEGLHSLPGRITWTKPQNLHVTMNFLGDVPDESIAGLCDLAREAVGDWDQALDEVTFTVGPLICFPPHKRTRMIWAPVGEGNDVLASLHAELNQALAAGGWRSESRPFKGHVTVARIKSADIEAAVRQLPDDGLGTVTTTEMTLYQSKPMPGGPIYTPLARIPLVRRQ
jgi:2'-5' RNA ligase